MSMAVVVVLPWVPAMATNLRWLVAMISERRASRLVIFLMPNCLASWSSVWSEGRAEV